jgi:hypothetical protein
MNIIRKLQTLVVKAKVQIVTIVSLLLFSSVSYAGSGAGVSEVTTLGDKIVSLLNDGVTALTAVKTAVTSWMGIVLVIIVLGMIFAAFKRVRG